MPPSVGDRVILVNGTVKSDRVAMRDLNFWLPYTKAHLCERADLSRPKKRFRSAHELGLYL